MPQDWRSAVHDCLTQYRAVGLFTADRFADAQAICDQLQRDYDLDAEATIIDAPDLWYAPLWALETDHSYEIPLKKGGAEGGPGYYADTIRAIFEKLSEPGTIQVRETPLDGGFVRVDLTTCLRPDWALETQQITLSQSFAPEVSWTDFTFVHQMLSTALGKRVEQVLARIGVNEEDALLVFTASGEAHDAIWDFENDQGWGFDDAYRSFGLHQASTGMPQPGPDTIDDIVETLALDHLPEDEIGIDHLIDYDGDFPDPNARPSLGERVLSIASFIAWGVAAVMIIQLVYTLIFSEPYCYPFEIYLPDTNECAINCEPGESQTACDARARALIDSFEASQ